MHVKPTETDIRRSQGIDGWLASRSRRLATQRAQDELDAAAALYRSAEGLHDAKGAFARAVARHSPENLRKVAEVENIRVDNELDEMQIRSAELKAKKARLNTELNTRNRDAETKDLLSQANYNAAMKALYGDDAKKEEEPDPAIRKKELEDQIEAVAVKVRELAEEYIAKREAGELTEELDREYARQNNKLLDQLAELEAELAAL